MKVCVCACMRAQTHTHTLTKEPNFPTGFYCNSKKLIVLPLEFSPLGKYSLDYIYINF